MDETDYSSGTTRPNYQQFGRGSRWPARAAKLVLHFDTMTEAEACIARKWRAIVEW